MVFVVLSGTRVSEGQKIGTVIKLADEGMFNTTHEVELVRGGMNNGSGGFSTTPLHATINTPGVLREAQAALDGQYEVRVWYVTYAFSPWSSETGRYLTRIERADIGH